MPIKDQQEYVRAEIKKVLDALGDTNDYVTQQINKLDV